MAWGSRLTGKRRVLVVEVPMPRAEPPPQAGGQYGGEGPLSGAVQFANVNVTGRLTVGGIIRVGATAYDGGTGFWLDRNNGTPRFFIGNGAGSKMTWDGTTLTVKGTINADAGYLDDLTVQGTLDVGTGGVIKSGATAYATGTGWWLDYNAGTPRFFIGAAAGNKLTWDGTTISITGTLNAGGGDVLIDTNGIQITGASAYGATHALRWITATVEKARIYQYEDGFGNNRLYLAAINGSVGNTIVLDGAVSLPSAGLTTTYDISAGVVTGTALKGPHLIRIPTASIAAAIDHTNTSGAAETWTSGDLRGATGIAAAARGVVGKLVIGGATGVAGDYALLFSADDTFSAGFQGAGIQVAGVNPAVTVVATFGTGGSAGKLNLYSSVNNLRSYFYPTHYWE